MCKIETSKNRKTLTQNLRNFVIIIFFATLFCNLPSLQAAPVPICHNYFLKSDLIQKFSPTEMDTLLLAAISYGRILDDFSATAQDAKKKINEELLSLQNQKKLNSLERKFFSNLFSEFVLKHQKLSAQALTAEHIQSRNRTEQFEEQKRILHEKKLRIVRIFEDYSTVDVNEALVRLCLSTKKDIASDMKLLFEIGADANYLKEGESILNLVSSAGNIQAANILLDAGAKIEFSDITKQTPLTKACHFKEPKMVELLIRRGAQINALDAAGRTPLMTAVTSVLKNQSAGSENIKTIDILLENGADINFQNKEGQTALMLAIFSQGSLLIRKGADLNLRDSKGLNALMYAIQFGTQEKIQSLLEAGTDLTAKTHHLSTALDYAHSTRDAEIIEMIQNAMRKQGLNP